MSEVVILVLSFVLNAALPYLVVRYVLGLLLGLVVCAGTILAGGAITGLVGTMLGVD